MKKRLMALLLLTGLLSAALTGCGGGSTEQASEDGQTADGSTEARAQANEIVVGIAQDLDESLDPHLAVAAGTKEVMFNVFEGLVKPTPDGDLVPAVADHYEISEDQTTYTFTLREGVQFHNGDPVEMRDVTYSIERCADDSEGTPLIPALSAISSIQADDTTLTITLDQPDSEFLSYLTLAILPEDYTDQATAPVGTGPFKFVSRTAQDSIVLERFDGYWGTPAQLDKVTFRIIENADSLVMSLQSGAIDMFAHLTSTQAAQLGDDFQVLEGTMNLVQALYLNNAAEPFNNEKVRQALCYAVDKQQIIDVAFDGYGSPIGSSMYPAFGKYFDESLTDYYTYDPDKAKALLAEAGYPNGGISTTLLIANSAPYTNIAQVIQANLKEIGIEVEIQTVEDATLKTMCANGEQELFLWRWNEDSKVDFVYRDLYYTGSGSNYHHYSDPHADELIDIVKTERDQEAREAASVELQEYLVEACPQVPLYIADLVIAYNKNLTGTLLFPGGNHDWSHAYIAQ